MPEPHPVSKALSLANDYLSGALPAITLVREIDDLIAGDYLAELDSPFEGYVSEFQDQLSLFVGDTETRKEAPGIYFCEDELPKKAQKFCDEVRAALVSLSR